MITVCCKNAVFKLNFLMLGALAISQWAMLVAQTLLDYHDLCCGMSGASLLDMKREWER
jgi:hypothetical protein